MCLPIPDVDRFYKVWKSLLFCANEQYQLIPAWKDADLGTMLHKDDVIPVRDRIWQDDQLLDRFIAQNPAKLSDSDLALADSWKYRRQGDFIVLKTLKKHAIFIAQDTAGGVFAVKGLYSPFSEMFPYLPMLVQAVLLPHGQEIVTDGLFTGYGISFGRGITGDLNAIYADARERGEIIASLLPSSEPASVQERIHKAEATNKKVLADFEKHLLRSGSSLKIVERDLTTVRQLAIQNLSHAVEPLSLRDLSDQELSAFLNGLPGDARRNAAIGLKRFVQFMRDTGRMDWDEAEYMLERLKR